MARIPSRPSDALTDPLRAAFDQWTVGALATNILWTRCLGWAAIAAAQRQRFADLTRHARMHSPYYRRAWRHLPAGQPPHRAVYVRCADMREFSRVPGVP